MRLSVRLFAASMLLASAATSSNAQQTRTHPTWPVCFGCRNSLGIRFAIRDRNLDRADGINITMLPPFHPTTGTVSGLAIGMPATGAAYIRGIVVAPVLVRVRTRLTGIAATGLVYGIAGAANGIVVAGLGGGVAEGMSGVAVNGVAMGVGGNADGIIAAGVGAGVRGNFRGLAVAGLGLGVSGDALGIVVTGLGAAIGGTMRGISVAGVGFGGKGSFEGVTVAALGAGLGGGVTGVTVVGFALGATGPVRGLTVAGLGVASSTEADGITVAGLAVVAPRIRKFAAAAMVVTDDARALVIAPAYFRAGHKNVAASANGIFVSAVNDVRGSQRGVSIGILNYARSLAGVQIGVLNIVADGRGPKMLPVINWR